MKTFIVSFLTAFVACLLLEFLGIRGDLFFNPWLRSAVADMHWWNVFTSHHGMTILYLKTSYFWMCLPAIPAAVLALMIWARAD